MWKGDKNKIVFLAYFNRYIFPMVSMLLAFFLADNKHEILINMAVVSLVLGLYNILGALLKWKHIYCSLQNVSRQVMTPDKIDWREFSFSDKYGMGILLSSFAVIIFILSFVNVI